MAEIGKKVSGLTDSPRRNQPNHSLVRGRLDTSSFPAVSPDENCISKLSFGRVIVFGARELLRINPLPLKVPGIGV